jgi:hypothetical protein
VKSVREHATLCHRKTGVMFTSDWFRPRPYRRGQNRAVVESQQGRRAAPHVYPCAERPQALLSRKAIGLGAKSGVDKAGRRLAVERFRRELPWGSGSAAPGASGRGGSLRVRSETRRHGCRWEAQDREQARAGCGWKAALAATSPGYADFPLSRAPA